MTTDYQKIPGRGRTWQGPARVWLGADHVLLVITRGYVEHYRRFFFKDIQAVLVRRSHAGKVWNGSWIAVLLLLAVIAVGAANDTTTMVIAAIASPFLIALVVNIALGPTCECFIRTAVQVERIPALGRLRAAEKFLATIEPRIAAAQGELALGELTTDLALLQSGQLVRSAEKAQPVPPIIGPQL